MGRLVEEKGVYYAIEAMKYLKETGLKLKVTGTLTEKEADLKALIDENGLADCVDFVGFKRGKELEDLISNCMCVLCPAIWYENMPNTVIEAYAYGKPVIASNFGCFPELIEEGRTGYLFEPKNSEQLAQKVRLLLDNDNLVSMGKQARAKVERDFSPEQHLSKLKEIFEN